MKKVFEKFQEELNNDSNDRKQADYKNEKGIKDEYNGRQFLELLQNIDDAKSKEALIKLDTKNNIVFIANSGNPFYKGGLKSLMMAHLSPKDKTFIGNKGLGFRSLLNWAGKIYVKSTNLSIEFSDENRKRQEQNNIKRSICSTPEWIDENNPRDWIDNIKFDKKYITYIAIYYKKSVEEKIIQQLNEISEELMYFITHLEEIKIIHDNREKIYKKEDWEILTKEELLPVNYRDEEDEKEYYQLKIIFPPCENSVNTYLFSYFPTNIKIAFPALIHATFELDSSRNTIVDDEKGKNRFIVKELANFIIETAEKLKEKDANWKAYEFVNIKHKNEILEKFGFYKIIEKWKETAEIYPCVDNTYRTKDDYAFYSNSFSDFMENHSEILGNILKRNNHFSEYSRCHTELISLFNSISKKISSIDKRAEFIKHILSIKKNNPTLISNSEQLILLINQDKKLKKELFFYDEIFLNLEIPSFIEINYIYPALQEVLDKDELGKITTVGEFNIQRDLIERIIESDKSIQEKLQALYPLRKFDKPSKGITGIKDKYIRDERILKIFEEKKIIEDYDNLGINDLEELDKFLIWLGAKEFNAQQVLKIIVDKNNEKKDIPSTLQALFILKDEFSDNLDNNRIRTDKDIYVLNAKGESKKIRELFPYKEECEKENVIAHKKDLGLEEYSNENIQSFLKWLEIKDFTLEEVALVKVNFLEDVKLDKDKVISILKFLFKNRKGITVLEPSHKKIYLLEKLARKLFFRTELTEKYFDKDKLLFPYDKLGFEDNEESKSFFRWLGVIEADKNLIVKQIFKSDIDIKEKLKELFSLFNKNDSIERPQIEFKLKSLNGQEKEAKELYINNDITRFCKKEEVVNIPVSEYSEEFFKWIGLTEPSREQIVKRLLELLTNKNILVTEIKDILSLLVDKYEESDEIDKNKPRYLFNNNKEILKTFELYQYDELAYRHISDSIVSQELELDEKFLWWIGIKKAEPFMIIRTLLKKKHKNLSDIFELWKQDVEIKPLPKNIPVKLLNKHHKEVFTSKLFLENSLTPFYDESELIIDYEQLELDISKDTEKFLLWLGVNRYIKYEKDGDSEKVYKIKEIAKLEFIKLFALLEVENILNNSSAKRDLQKEHPNYWILHNYGIDLINPPIEYENNSKRINLLKQFGVKENFEEKNTLFLLKKLSIIDKNGRYSPSIYKEILDKNFDFSNEKFSIFSKNREYKNNMDLYYLTTSKHPKFILKQYDFIDLPINLDKDKIYNTFGVDEIIDIQYTIRSFEERDSTPFIQYFEKIKPYLLAFGSIGIKDTKEKEFLANELKTLKIQFGNFDCFTDDEKIELEEFEMISSNNIFYLKCEDGISDEFTRNMNLTDSIENILLTINFNNHSKFRDIFRQGDFEELEKTLSHEHGSTILEDAKVLLGKMKKNIPSVPAKALLDKDEKLAIAQKEFREILEQNFSNFEQNLYIWCGKHHQEKKFISLIDKYNNIKINSIEEIDYNEYIKKYLLDNFHFSLTELDEYIDIQAIFTKNKELVEYDKIVNKTEYRSLLHFDDKIDEIKKYIASLSLKDGIKPTSKGTVGDIPIVDIDLTNKEDSGKGRGGRIWKPSPTTKGDSAEVGLSSEEKVYKKLVKEFGIKNVHWDANRVSDTYGYDMWYRNKSNETKYVEVKTYSTKGRFYISPNEVKFAKDNKEAYELYLVEDETIYRVNNFHKLKKIIENYTVKFSV